MNNSPATVNDAVIVTPNLTVAMIEAMKMMMSNKPDVRYTIHFNTGIDSIKPTKPAKVNIPKNIHVANVPPMNIPTNKTMMNNAVFMIFIYLRVILFFVDYLSKGKVE